MEFIQAHQLNIMLVLSGICGMLAFLAFKTKSLSKKRRAVLVLLELGAMCLLLSDRLCYLHRGDVSPEGYWIVRICNFLVFFLTIFLPYFFNCYLMDLYTNEGKMEKPPHRLKIASICLHIAALLLFVSQFTDLFYSFDAQNRYQRAPLYFLSYAAPLIASLIQLSVIVKYRHLLSLRINISLFLFASLPYVASIVQFFFYGISITNITFVGMTIAVYVFALSDLNDSLDRATHREIEYLKEEQQHMHELFEQTAQALSGAIDAKDEYTHGHSTRVAEYSEKVARMAGKSDHECEEIYFAALLHDVGKIGIPDTIINKSGKLTEAEFAVIKEHPVIGKQILCSISRSPYLSLGANYHHERYDGKGYPEGRKGEDIPELARIVAVADAYDAMTSRRSYRDPLPQHKVREEFVKGSGTQFDPFFAGLMLQMIDSDTEYQMREKSQAIRELAGKSELQCDEFMDNWSAGFLIEAFPMKIHLRSVSNPGYCDGSGVPSLILFDAMDGRLHHRDDTAEYMHYDMYGSVSLNGKYDSREFREVRTHMVDHMKDAAEKLLEAYTTGVEYDIEMVRWEDHLRIRTKNRYQTTETIIALPDCSRFVYAALSGAHCFIDRVVVDKDPVRIADNAIPRIAEKISYIDGPEGDVPNVQVDRWRSAATKGIPITDGMILKFHTMTLPTATLIWHCPFVSIFSSLNGSLDDPDCHEYILLRLDGENWESDATAENRITCNKTDDFVNWEVWKENNKKGLDCELAFSVKGNSITVKTTNSGIAITSVTKVNGELGRVYVALTGDQCALTNIRVINGK